MMKLSLEEAKARFLEILDGVEVHEAPEFLAWIASSFSSSKDENESTSKDLEMHEIISQLRPMIPVSAILPSEQICYPDAGIDADCRPEITVHVDSFLYGIDDDIDMLCETGALSRNYCTACGSHATKPLTFISHSASLRQLRFVFEDVLPPLTGKCVLDVGSRTGAVLFTAYVFSQASKIVGIEMDLNWCSIQKDLAIRHAMTDRLEIVCGRIEDSQWVFLMEQADVIVLNNVFQFFADRNAQSSIWKIIRSRSHSKQVIVTLPSVEEMLAHVEVDFEVSSWLRHIEIDHLVKKKALDDLEIVEELSKVHLYEVL